MLLYFVVLLLNVVRVYFLHSYAHVAGTNRDFYDFAMAIGCYAVAAHYFAQGKVTVQRFVTALFRLSLVVCLVGVIAAVAHLSLYAGDLRYSVYGYGNNGGAVRVGFLEDVGIFGFAAVAAGVTGLRSSWAKSASGLLFLAAIYESGGRGAAAGLVGAVAIWLLLSNKAKFFFLTAGIAVALLFMFPLLKTVPQVQRLTDINAAQLNADGRTLLYHDQFQEFGRIRCSALASAFRARW